MAYSNQAEIRRAVELLKSGDRDGARAVLTPVLKSNPNNADAWYVASQLVTEPAKRVEFLNRALQADPQHARAQQALTRMQAVAPRSPAALPEAKQKPPMTQKQKDDQTRTWVTAGLGVMLIVSILVMGLILIRRQQQNFDAVSAQLQSIPTLIPTFTFAPVLPTDTPSASPTPEPATATAEPSPTVTSTPHPLEQTATTHRVNDQTAEAFFRITLTSAALTHAPPGS